MQAVCTQSRLQAIQGFVHFAQMLMREGLISLNIIGAPGKMGSRRQTLSRARGSGNSGAVHVRQPSFGSKGKKSKLKRRRKTSGIGDGTGTPDLFTVHFWQSVDKR